LVLLGEGVIKDWSFMSVGVAISFPWFLVGIFPFIGATWALEVKLLED